MSGSLFKDVLVPVASEDDARDTMRALLPYLDSAGGTATLVNVIEKAGGAPDKASVQQREEHAVEIFNAARDVASDSFVEVGSEIVYGTDVAETIIETARDRDTSAIVFTPRKGSRWLKLLTGDVGLSLVTESDLPVIALPNEDEP